MNIYVESNFVLELSLLQEQEASCEELLQIGEAGRAKLIVPAYSLMEPYETLVRRHRQRKQMKTDLDVELRQLTRTAAYAQRLSGFHTLTALLIDSADEESHRLERVRTRLLKTCEVIALNASTLLAAGQYRHDLDLSPQDALVYAAVLSHLVHSGSPASCFLNRNSKDFDDPRIVDELRRRNCTLIPRFDHGLEHVRKHLGKGDQRSDP